MGSAQRVYHACALALVGLAGPAVADDGVLEINQACATGSGCFPGDIGLFPVTITATAGASSFRLTSDLIVPNAGTTAIDISVAGVTLDIGGFSISGVTTCTGAPVTSCSPTGAGVGVLGVSDVTVKNGTIRGMGNDGVRLAYSSRAEGLQVLQNGDDGIVVGNESIAWRNIVTSNGGDGVRCASQCAISDNTSTGNRFDGLDLLTGSASRNTATLNGGRGGEFGVLTGFAQNMFSSNAPPDVNGGHATGGNVCGDGSCSQRGARHFFLTTASFTGATAAGACAAGFHMASLWEIFDPASLEYDTTRGQTKADSGSGAVTFPFGWIRTGSSGSSGSATEGSAGCDAHTTTSGSGTVVQLTDSWGGSAGQIQPWQSAIALCSGPFPVWCVEN